MTSRRHRPSADKGLVRGAGSRRESRAFALGTLAFGALLWLAGAAPWSLPAVYLAFSAVALPYRAIEFGTGRNAFFLLDFCYARRGFLPFPSVFRPCCCSSTICGLPASVLYCDVRCSTPSLLFARMSPQPASFAVRSVPGAITLQTCWLLAPALLASEVSSKCQGGTGLSAVIAPGVLTDPLSCPQWVNLATVGLLVLAPGNLQLEAAVYALADGPLAAALIAWQSAWVFGSPSHVIRCVALVCCG